MKVYELSWSNEYLDERGMEGIFPTAQKALAAINTPEFLDNAPDDTEFYINSWELGKSCSYKTVMPPTTLCELKSVNFCISFPEEKEKPKEEEKQQVLLDNGDRRFTTKLSPTTVDFLDFLVENNFFWDEVTIQKTKDTLCLEF